MHPFALKVAELAMSHADTLTVYPYEKYGSHHTGLISIWWACEWEILVYRDDAVYRMTGDEQCGEMCPDVGEVWRLCEDLNSLLSHEDWWFRRI